MKTLTEYSKNGYNFTLHSRDGDVAIFHGRATQSESESWEVIRIQSHNGREIQGKYFEPAEYPPSNEQFGRLGWSMPSEESARVKMAKVIEHLTLP
jgi:hypothetical protein